MQALAGTGKTTTLVLLARALMDRSPQARIVYTAFNASIVKGAKRGRFGRNVTASTMHSLARQALLQTSYAGKIEHADKGARWPEQWAEVLGIPEGSAAETQGGAAPADAVEVARLVIATVRKFRESADGEPGRQHLPHMCGPAGSPLSETVLSYARQAWADISSTGNAKALAAGRALRIEHDDYLKVWALSRPRIDAQVIFFDEAQDVNDVMRALVLDQPTQTVVVGDSHQSIYGFRGAIDALKDWPADIVLPLTQSWRFGPAAAEFGNLFLRSLGSKLLLEGNPARETQLGSAPEPDAILCRTNATAVAEVFAGLESGKRTALAGGGDAIKEIAKAARDLQAGKGTKHPDLSRFTDWDEVRQYAKNDEDGKSLQVFVRLIDQHGPGGLIDMIGRLTPEDDTRNPPQLTISTAHKAKGLEWDVVRVAGDFRGPVTDPETGEVAWPSPEERRLAYVAATRARKLLEPGSLGWIYDYPLPGTRAAQGPASGQDREARAAVPDAPRHTASQPKPAARVGLEQKPASQDSRQPAQARPGHSTTDGAPGRQPAPVSTTADAPESTMTHPPPSAADFDRARYAARDTSPVQEALFGDVPDSAQPPDERAALGTGQAADPHPGAAVPDDPAHDDEPDPPQMPATNSDLAIALHSMSGQELTSFLILGKTPDGHGSLTGRRNGLPDAGASQMLNFDHGGVRITVSSRRFRRHGQISWRQVASWIDSGLTPARFGIIIGASQLCTFTNARRDQLIAAGKDNIDAAITELRQISNDAIDAALSAALGTRDADAPVPPANRGKPAYRSTAMLTCPDPSATPEENTALARIAELSAAIRGTQPVTPADIRTAIRWWIGDNLPEYARALASPEAMRAWICRQASGPASRPGRDIYDSALGRYYSATPEGLRTSKGGDTRTAPYILWEEIPAWIQPGLSLSLRGRLAAATTRQTPGGKRTAAARPPASADVVDQADEPPPRPLREAIDAAWAAIDAAPPPSTAELNHARAVYRGTGTQQRLPSSGAMTGQSGSAKPSPRHHAAAEIVATSSTVRSGSAPAPAALPQPAGAPALLTGDDIFLGISRLPHFVIGDLFHAIDTGQHLKSVGRQLAPYSGERAPGEPDPGAREAVTAEPAGLRIQVSSTGSRRTGLITWERIAELLRPGLTPARRQIVVQSWQVRVGFMAANASFRVVGEGHLATAAEGELRVHAAAAVAAILAAVHPGDHAPPPADEAATVERIAELAAALPGRPAKSRTHADQVTAGDIIGHPSYRFQPFRITAPPRCTDTTVEITGRLTEPTGIEPAGQITLTLPRSGRPGSFVGVIPVPARSLRPLFPGFEAVAGTGQLAIATRPDGSHRPPADTAQTLSSPIPEPDADTPSSQSHATETRRKEGTMSPAANSAASLEIPLPAEPGTAPETPPATRAPAPPGLEGQPATGRDAPRNRTAAGPGDGTSVVHELERLLDAIRERSHAVGGQSDTEDFTDIRAAFAAMRDVLGLSAASPADGGLSVARSAPEPARPAPEFAATPVPPPRGGPSPVPDGFSDIQVAFADLRNVLGLPARGRHARTGGPYDRVDAAIADMLDHAAAEAQACARWYRDTPEWQRISTVSRAARGLVAAIREAAGDYWVEIRLDIRVRGFARTLAARTALAVSGAAHALAGRIEKAGHRDTPIWRAAWRLHQATTTFANRIMRYTPPSNPDTMREARRIIDDLGRRQNRAGQQPEPGHHTAPRSTSGARTPNAAANAAALASASFPVMITRVNARQATAASAARTAGSPAQQRHATRRQ